ncbi:hypothetical protein V475_02555 [Sphingobium baderi LL03]|nr:hypothetical protein V475_02555 [Sphingobium baderi LL03]
MAFAILRAGRLSWVVGGHLPAVMTAKAGIDVEWLEMAGRDHGMTMGL